MPNLVVLFYYAFLSIFCLTAIVAIGSLVRIRPFHRVEDKYRARLFSVLIVEVVGAVLIIFRELPIPGKPFVESYKFEAYYQDYEQKIRDSLGPDEKTCVESTQSAALPQCLDALNDIEAARAVADKVGQGKLLLIGKVGDQARSGVLLFRFPGVTNPIAILITVSSTARNRMTLRFTQSERAIRRDGLVYIRPEIYYSIDYVKSSDGRTFEGTLFNPRRKLPDGHEIAEANTTITPE